MKILKEHKEEWTKMDVDMSKEEIDMLIAYGKKNIMSDEMELINWAFTDILKKSIDEGLFDKNAANLAKKVKSVNQAKAKKAKKIVKKQS